MSTKFIWDFQGGANGKKQNPPANVGDIRDAGFNP